MLLALEWSESFESLQSLRHVSGLFDSLLLHKVGLERSSSWRSKSYDLWSLGILLLEMVLGTRERATSFDSLQQTGTKSEDTGKSRHQLFRQRLASYGLSFAPCIAAGCLSG